MLAINEGVLESYRLYLQEHECSRATIDKYMRDVRQLGAFCGGSIQEKSQLLGFKEYLLEKRYAIASINSMLAAVNRFLSFAGYDLWKMRYLKVQRTLFIKESRELKRREYEAMLQTAEKQCNKRLSMLLQTICATGIRVSELKAITVESLSEGHACIQSKGKLRHILLPAKLCRMLKRYCQEAKIRTGSVFVTKSGKPMDRSNIWRMMKQLAHKTKIQAEKVFPHNLRHLFACTYYEKYKDIVRLADILGHSSINTTRIYTMSDTFERQKQLDKLCLLLISTTT